MADPDPQLPKAAPEPLPPGRHVVEITLQQAGTRLDRALAEAMPALSRSRVKALIEAGNVAANSGLTLSEPSMRVKPGQRISIDIPEAIAATPLAEKIPLVILHEDDQLLVIDKQAGLVVHPAPGNSSGTLVNALLEHCGASLSGIGGVKRPGIVHRLDKDTSGVMVVAKTDHAHRALSAQFADHSVERAYRALVWGHPSPGAGTIEGAIGRSNADRKKMTVRGKGGKHAATLYRTLKRFNLDGRPVAAMVECRLRTGRTHQVRVHMAHLGNPVIGDPVYGRRRKLPPGHERLGQILAAFPRQALHAYLLGFYHPTRSEKLSFESALPTDIQALVDALTKAGRRSGAAKR